MNGLFDVIIPNHLQEGWLYFDVFAASDWMMRITCANGTVVGKGGGQRLSQHLDGSSQASAAQPAPNPAVGGAKTCPSPP